MLAACVQMNVTDDFPTNLGKVRTLVAEAAYRGAALVALPEHAFYLNRRSAAMQANAFEEKNHPALQTCQDLAHDHGVWLSPGSLSILEPATHRLRNRAYLIDSAGDVVARYDKIHMFETTLDDGRRIAEADTYESGDEVVVTRTPWFQVGLSICYDLRFPDLYRHLALGGAQVLLIPAAFLKETGKAHWHVLVRARAIETGCFVIAAATVGSNPSGHCSYGHCLVVDPWGKVLVDGGEQEGVYLAEIDMQLVEQTAARLRTVRPSLNYRLKKEPKHRDPWS